jgi:lipopolysaccharide export system ATP-binding protein
MDVLRVEQLEKTYGRRKVVQGVSFRVGSGEIVGLLGPNGAGKSTSFRMTCGLVQPDRGKVFLGEEDVTHWPMFLRARDGGMGYLAQEPSVFKKLTVEQNISAILEMLGQSWKDRRKRTQELLELLNITHIRDSKAATLSGGERRRLEIARCLVSNPKIIMLDEPYAGVDPVTVQSMRPIIHQLRSAGISILITDHDAQEILKSVNRCYVIDEGKVFCEGDPDTVRRNPQVRKKYLGELADLDAVGPTHQRIDTPGQQQANVPAPKKGLFERLNPRRRSP